MDEWDVIELFETKIASAAPCSHTLRGACGALADWMAREWNRLSVEDQIELVSVGAVMLLLSGYSKQKPQSVH